MRGASRGAALAGERALASALAGGASASDLAEELFAVTGAVDANATLRRALADPSREGAAKRDLVGRLFSGKLGAGALGVLADLAAERWSTERDLTDTSERLAVRSVLETAEREGRLDTVEEELFRFERIVAGDPALRDAITNPQGVAEGKADLVSQLLDGKVAPETVRLARQAVLAPRGRKFSRTIEEFLQVAAARREQLTAVVTSAVPLDEASRGRLSTALTTLYGKPVLLQVVVDEDVVGGLKVRVGDEVIDGTIARKLDGARRHLAG
ncbi:F0F1 ATP synthase subunit delta [Janibacter sp. G1551]|uniref:F0F1 ATP synthase subunit delta n=1 Tax=Janibacter sp. G1551 TaxID=3420440 RepID=UPI003D0294CB